MFIVFCYSIHCFLGLSHVAIYRYFYFIFFLLHEFGNWVACQLYTHFSALLRPLTHLTRYTNLPRSFSAMHFSKFLIKHPLDTLPLHFSLLSVSTWEVKRLLCRDYSENLRPGFAGSLLQGYQALVPAHASKYHVITYAWELQFCQHRGPWVDDVSFVLKNILDF